MIENSNYYLVFYWMINELGLKGAELPVFAIIHSFSQDGVGKFTGSLNYLADFAGLTRQGVIKVLKKLIEKNYIIKEQRIDNGVKYNTYQVNFKVVNRVDIGSKQSLQGRSTEFTGGSKQSLPNNKSNNDIDNTMIKDIVEYLNEKTGSRYRWQSKDTQKHIKARLKEGYTIDDFKKVIDIKCSQWLNDSKMSDYLRPSTLFGSKFESYLNQRGTSNNNGDYQY